VRATSWDDLRVALSRSLETPGVSIIAIPVDRDRNVAQHREIERSVGAALAASRKAKTS
jgi:2-succinyl-5-enolpyruvyl-6-hydroxy-3-cyclohexene-1-carboxylate synthase